MDENPLINLIGITKTYLVGKVKYEVLKGINLTIERGDFLAIMGPSGGGKSTLLNILGLLDRPTSGKYIFEGIEISKLSSSNLAKIRNSKIGFVFQAFHLIPWATALENVLMPLLYGEGISQSKIEYARELLERLGLGNYLNFRPPELSGGQQQRVAIARALINNPVLLLADEPTGNLDSKSSAEVMNILQELNRQGLTIVMVTHDQEIAKRAKKVKILKDGHFVES